MTNDECERFAAMGLRAEHAEALAERRRVSLEWKEKVLQTERDTMAEKDRALVTAQMRISELEDKLGVLATSYSLRALEQAAYARGAAEAAREERRAIREIVARYWCYTERDDNDRPAQWLKDSLLRDLDDRDHAQAAPAGGLNG